MNNDEPAIEEPELPPPSQGELVDHAAQALEDALIAAGGATPELDTERLRLARMYLEQLDDPVSAAVHVESLLERVTGPNDPAVELALDLMSRDAVAARVGEKLSGTFRRLGDVAREVEMLETELGVATVPRVFAVKKRLAHLRHSVLGDTDGALSLLEELLSDAPDDAVRVLYLRVAVSSGHADRAARTLQHVLDGERDPAARAAALHDLGVVRTAQSDVTGAVSSFAQAIETGAATNAAVESAQHILRLGAEAADTLGPALAAIVLWSSDEGERSQAASRLSTTHTEVLSALEDQKKYKALCCVLEALSQVLPAERAVHFARLGQVRLHLRNATGAFAAFEQSLEADPRCDAARQTLEGLMARGAHRGPAAAILEPIYRSEDNDSGVLRALGARADVTPSAAERLRLLDQACELALASESGRPFAVGFVGRGLREAVQYAPDTLPTWIERARAASAHLPDRRAEARLLSTALGERPLTSPELVELARAAYEALTETRDHDRAFSVGLSLFDAEPTLGAARALETQGKERLDTSRRISMYEAVIQHGPAGDRVPAQKALAALHRDELGDPTEALMILQRVLTDTPDDAEAIEGLIATYAKLDDPNAMLAEIDEALSVVDGPARARITLQKAEALSRVGQQEDAAGLLGALLDVATADEVTLEGIAARAHEDDEQELYRRALERLADSPDAITRTRALERLGDYHFDFRGDRQSAIDSWKPAAELRADLPEDKAHAQTLYERILDASPNDTDAAQHLVSIYSRAGQWDRVPEVYSILLRAAQHPDEPIELLIDLEEPAIQAGAIDELVSMLDETVPRVGPDAQATLGHLLRIKARALETVPDRVEEAARAYRDLLEVSDDEEDLVAYERLTERLPDVRARHEHARRQWSWHARNTLDPTKVFSEWAKAEEDSDDLVAAIDVYERALLVNPNDHEILENLVRLKSSLGDADGEVAALGRLRSLSSDDDKTEIDLRIASLLVGPLGRPGDAVETVADLLFLSPPRAEAEQIVERALSSGVDFDRVADRIERTSRNAPDEACAARILRLLLSSSQVGKLAPERRAEGYVRLAELAETPEERGRELASAIGAMPSSDRLWDAIEEVAKSLGSPKILYEAFRAATERTPPPPPEVVEKSGKRVVEHLDNWSSTAPELAPTLSRVLEHCPGARWALDRVKLALSAQGRWDELFSLYDAAIARAQGERRAELLDEAAVCARDLANSPKHAVAYLEPLRDLRPDDAGLRAALERMYERLGKVAPLLELLQLRLPETTGRERVTVRRRIATLLARMGDNLAEAERTVELALGDGGKPADVVEPLEAILAAEPAARHEAVQARAADRLREHFARAENDEASIRVMRRAVEVITAPERRQRWMRELVSLRLKTEPESEQRFARVSAKLTEDAQGDSRLLAAGLEVFLDEAMARWRADSAAQDGDEAQASWWAVHALREHLTAAGRAEDAAAIMEKACELPFDNLRKRALKRDLAWLRWDRLGQKAMALDALRSLLSEDPIDAVASGSLSRFVQALIDEGRDEEHAELREAMGSAYAKAGKAAEAVEAYQTAAGAWKALGEIQRAISAHERAAELGALDSLEAMARLHVEQQDFRGAADAFERLVGRSSSDRRSDHAMALADACERLGQPSRARGPLEAALEDAPRAGAVRRRLAKLYQSEGDFAALAALLEESVQSAESAAERLVAVKRLAAVYLGPLGDPGAAIEPLRQARQLDPSDVDLARDLGDALMASGEIEDAVALLRSSIFGFGDRRPKERAVIHQRLARALSIGKQEDAAFEQLEAAASIDPTSPNVLADLARLHLARDNFELAESTYRSLLLALHHHSDESDVPKRVTVYLALSDLARRRGDADRAEDLIASAFEAAATDEDESRTLTSLLQQRGDTERLLGALRQQLELCSDPEAKAVIVERLAANRPDPATLELLGRELEAIWEQASESNLTSPRLWEATLRASRVVGQEATDQAVERYVSILDRVADRARDSERTSLWREMARVTGQSERHAHLASSALEKILAEDPDDTEAALSLANVYAGQGHNEEAADRLQAQRDRAEQNGNGSQATRLSLALADVLSRCEKQAEALAATEHVLRHEPRSPDVLDPLIDRLQSFGSPRLKEALELRLAAEASGSARVPSLARRLYEAAESAGDEKAMRDALERGLDAAPGETFFVVALARTHLETGHAREALHTIAPALAEHGDDAGLLRLRGQALCALEQHEEAIVDLERARAIDHSGEQELIEALREAARSSSGAVHAAHLFDLLDAKGKGAEAREALERHEDDRGALERLALLATRDKRHADAEAAHRALLARSAGDPTAERELSLAIADDCRRQGDLGRARDVLEAAHAADPGPKTLGLLKTIYERDKNNERLAELLAEEAGQAPEGERAALWCRAAELLVDVDPIRALALAEQVEGATTTDVNAHRVAAKAALALGNREAARARLSSLTSTGKLKDAGVISQMQFDLGKAHLEADELFEALDALKEAFRLDRRSTEAALLLGLVAVDLDDDETAGKALRTVAAMSSGASSEDKATAYRELARMALRAGDRTRARLMARNALGEAPDDPVTKKLVEML